MGHSGNHAHISCLVDYLHAAIHTETPGAKLESCPMMTEMNFKLRDYQKGDAHLVHVARTMGGRE
jgi:hypothetical protein